MLERRISKKRRAEIEAELNPDPPPACLSYLFSIHNRLRRRKGSAGFGATPIEWTDFDAFMRLTQTALSPMEIEILEDLDDLYLIEKSKRPD